MNFPTRMIFQLLLPIAKAAAHLIHQTLTRLRIAVVVAVAVAVAVVAAVAIMKVKMMLVEKMTRVPPLQNLLLMLPQQA
jgi:hypothetical protein